MKITYLFNSGFAVEFGQVLLVFDDYKDPAHAVARCLRARGQKSVFFFASHGHFDHFNGEELARFAPQVTRFFLSSDIKGSRGASSGRMRFRSSAMGMDFMALFLWEKSGYSFARPLALRHSLHIHASLTLENFRSTVRCLPQIPHVSIDAPIISGHDPIHPIVLLRQRPLYDIHPCR